MRLGILLPSLKSSSTVFTAALLSLTPEKVSSKPTSNAVMLVIVTSSSNTSILTSAVSPAACAVMLIIVDAEYTTNMLPCISASDELFSMMYCTPVELVMAISSPLLRMAVNCSSDIWKEVVPAYLLRTETGSASDQLG